MSSLRSPDSRRCERCGRRERWDGAVGAWRVDDSPGRVFCLHEWDITGTFVPVEERDPVAAKG